MAKKKRGSGTIVALGVIALVLGAVGYYWYAHQPTAPAIGVEKSVPGAILTKSIDQYLSDQHSPLAGKVTIGVPVIEGDYARVTVTPIDSMSGDAAIGFLHKRGSTWDVIAVGTVFEPEFYVKHQIPRSLQL
jgi:hypothetical protein